MRRPLLALLLAACLATPARGAEPDAACPPGNLLATARLVDSLDVVGASRLALDSTGVREGAPWTAASGARFETTAGSLTFDLGTRTRIAAAYLQGDAYSTFSLQVSDDGATFREIWKAPKAAEAGEGMRSRSQLFWDEHARFVRFGEPTGNGTYAFTEIQVFCKIPGDWPPRLAVAAPTGSPGARHPFRFTQVHSDAAKIVIALLAAVVLVWGSIVKRRGAPDRHRVIRDALLVLLGILSIAAYQNWEMRHRVHNYEFFHYYIGSKYFQELGYTRIYECASVAEAEQGFVRRVELRKIRDLTKNELVPAKYVLEEPDRFKTGFIRPFSPQRWEAFKKDVAYFREHAGAGTWNGMLMDNGYNPSPAWNMTGSLLANLAPASEPFILALSWIDTALLVLAFGLVAWAFGWRTACVAVIFFGTNAPAISFWTGGAYLRQDWFLWAVAGICFLKRGRPLLGGAGLAVSTLLRVFPIGFFVAIAFRLLWILASERRLDRTGLKIVAGAALAAALVIPTSSMVAGGFEAWPAFLRNTAKHADTPLTNYMGLKTVLSFRWETRQKASYDPNQIDPFHAYKEARRQAFRGIFGRPFFVLFVGAYLLLLFRGTTREMDWWVLAAFGFGVIAVCLELTCYYYSFLTVAALLGEKREGIPIGLLVLAAVSQVVSLGTYFYDMRYTFESVVVLVFVLWATWVWARRRPANGSPPARKVVTAG